MINPLITINKLRLIGLAALWVLCGVATAGEAEERIRQAVAALLPSAAVDRIVPAPVSGLYEVVVGPRVFYVSADGKYLIQGGILDLQSKENITQPSLMKARADAVAKVGEENMIIFGKADLPNTITVFTDIDCGFCRKLHSEIAEYNKRGIRVRYLFFPRAGAGSPSFLKAVSVWCSGDRQAALTKSKNGEEVPQKECENPVADHLILGELMGVTGTPTIVLPSGEALPGYVPPERLEAYLKQ